MLYPCPFENLLLGSRFKYTHLPGSLLRISSENVCLYCRKSAMRTLHFCFPIASAPWKLQTLHEFRCEPTAGLSLFSGNFHVPLPETFANNSQTLTAGVPGVLRECFFLETSYGLSENLWMLLKSYCKDSKNQLGLWEQRCEPSQWDRKKKFNWKEAGGYFGSFERSTFLLK